MFLLATFVSTPFSQVPFLLHNVNAITSEDYITIAGEKLLVWPQLIARETLHQLANKLSNPLCLFSFSRLDELVPFVKNP